MLKSVFLLIATIAMSEALSLAQIRSFNHGPGPGVVASCPPEWAACHHHLGSGPVRTSRRDRPFRQHKNQGIECEWDSLEDLGKLSSYGSRQELPGNIVGGHTVGQEERRLQSSAGSAPQ